MPTINIPPGWYQLKPGTLIVHGDWCIRKESHPAGHFNIEEWEPCDGLIDRTVDDWHSDHFYVIRQGANPYQPEPTVEKEWLNPWD